MKSATTNTSGDDLVSLASSSASLREREDDSSNRTLKINRLKKSFLSKAKRVFRSSKKQDKKLRERLQDTHRVDGKKVLLHGDLRIHVIQGSNLRTGSAPYNCCCRNAAVNYLPAYYVTVHAGPARLVKTKRSIAVVGQKTASSSPLSPEWDQDYYVPIAHHVETIEFRVKTTAAALTSRLLGSVHVKVSDLLRYDKDDRPVRTGIHRVAYLDKKKRHGSLEFIIEFTPKELTTGAEECSSSSTDTTGSSMGVPGVYFSPQRGNNLRLYMNADDSGQRPAVTYGPMTGPIQTWQPSRLWRDVYDSICRADKVIYILGWSVDPFQSLLRGDEKEAALQGGDQYSPFIGELLKKKAEQGVAVFMIVWDDQTSNQIVEQGALATHDEILRKFFQGTCVNLCLAPMIGGESYSYLEKLRTTFFFTHHQKCIICDEGNALIGYVGGVDLTDGRYEDGTYPLFRSLQSEHLGDVHNACFALRDPERVGPRQPWRDIHCRVSGPAVRDLVQNFEERWTKQGSFLAPVPDLSEMTYPEIDPPGETWTTQVFRSIDARTAAFDEEQVWKYPPTKFGETRGVRFIRNNDNKKKSGRALDRIFVSDDEFLFRRALHQKRNRNVDTSAHRALLHYIRNAKHSIYIENQYFVSSSHIWETNRSECQNQVAAEISFKICEKIAAGERFAAYIVIPMWPEGPAESQSVQEILFWQRQTVQGMYKRIAKAIDQRGDENLHPTDYLNFYCLGNREEEQGSQAYAEPTLRSIDELLTQTRRHPIYVHSKMVIVDDSIVLIGSANINQRSLDGSRDSEILIGAWQPAHLATDKSIACGDAHGFRLSCWTDLTRTADDVFREPFSLACVKKLNEIARANWKAYSTQDEVVEMTSYLLPYPYQVGSDGNLSALTSNGCFPDTKGKILGSKSILPDILTS